MNDAPLERANTKRGAWFIQKSNPNANNNFMISPVSSDNSVNTQEELVTEDIDVWTSPLDAIPDRNVWVNPTDYVATEEVVETPTEETVTETVVEKKPRKRRATKEAESKKQTLTKVDDKSKPTQRQRKLIYEWLNKQDLDREHPLVPMLMNDILTQGEWVWGYVYGAISQILWHSGIDFNKATDFFKSIGIDPEWWEREMKSAPTYYFKGKVVNEKTNTIGTESSNLDTSKKGLNKTE